LKKGNKWAEGDGAMARERWNILDESRFSGFLPEKDFPSLFDYSAEIFNDRNLIYTTHELCNCYLAPITLCWVFPKGLSARGEKLRGFLASWGFLNPYSWSTI